MKNLLFYLLIFTSCANNYKEKDIIGVYVSNNCVNTIDTFQILKNGIYIRKVCDSQNHLKLNYKAKWDYYDGNKNVLQFRSFFMNLDRDINKFPELISDTTGGWTVELFNNSTISFCVGYSLDKNHKGDICYSKIE